MKKKWILLIPVALLNFLAVCGINYFVIYPNFKNSILGNDWMIPCIIAFLVHIIALLLIEIPFLKLQWCGVVKYWLIVTLSGVILSGIVCIGAFVGIFASFFTSSFKDVMGYSLAALAAGYFCAEYSFIIFVIIGVMQILMKKIIKIKS